MAPVDKCLASMARLSLSQASRPTISMVPRYLAPAVLVQSRQASVVRVKKGPVKKKAVSKDFRRHNFDKTDFPRFSLVEAMRYDPIQLQIRRRTRPIPSRQGNRSN